MKLASLAWLAALCLTAPLAHAAPGEPATAEQPRRDPAASSPKPAAAKPDSAAKDPAPRDTAKESGTRDTGPKPEAARAERPAAAPVVVGREKRRRSYAACNRASHQRGYQGGKRRRFLIRCRLGYERTRTPQHQAPAPTAPPLPVRKP